MQMYLNPKPYVPQLSFSISQLVYHSATPSTMAALRRALLQKSRNAIISFSSTPSPTSSQTLGLRGLRFLSSIAHVRPSQPYMQTRNYSAVRTESSLNDPSPNWSNRPPKETILLDGCDFEHWLIVMEPPQPDVSRDEIIQSYIKTLAQVVGSEDEARMKIYSVSTKHYYAFGALVSEELSFKIKPLPGVRWVLPDSYLDPRTKDYGGEPFINGQAVPYDPKYHEEWVRNNAKCNDRRNNDRPRNFDRSRNFERRREMQQQSRPNVPQRPPPGSPAPNQLQYPNPSPGPGLPPTSPEYPNSSPQQPYSSPPQNPAYGQPQYPAPPQPPRGGYNAGPAPPQGYYNPQQPGGQYSGPPAPPQPGYAPPQPNNNAPPAGQYQDGYYNR